MTSIDTLFREPVVQAVGWALLHFIWQGALVGAGAALALRLLRHGAADVRYVVAAIALTLMATMPVVTGVQAWRAASVQGEAGSAGQPPQAMAAGTSPVAAADAPAAGPCADAARCAQASAPGLRVEPFLPALVLTWMAGVVLLALRLAGGWVRVQRLKATGASAAGAPLQAIVRRLTKTLHISRPVKLLQSSSVDVPTVIGWLKPTILLPIGALAGLSPLQVEAILAHELAHVRRHDYLVNLLQTVVETLLFYHPAVWWLSRRIRIEREHCCDDLAVSLCGDPVVYARALADLEELRDANAHLAMAANGGSLVDRVRRLLAAPATHAGRGPAWLAAAAAVLLMVGIIAGPPGRQPMDAQEMASPAPVTLSAAAGDDPGQAPPAPPAPPVPPAPPAPSGTSHESSQSGSGTISWSGNGEKVVVKYNGAFTVNDTDTDIATLSPGGYVRVSDGAWLRGRSVEFSADARGHITRRFTVGGSERPFEPEGREWLARIFPRFIRQSGLNAKERVARFLSRGGIDAVLAEIAQIDGSYGKRLYFSQLLRQAPLDAGGARRVLEQAGREIDSDYELATLLIDVTGRLVLDDAAREAYFAAAKRIGSDYEMRRVYTAALDRGGMTVPLMVSLLEGSRELDSDYEAATLLIDVVRRQRIDGAVRTPFFDALATIGSAYEKARVLQALLRPGQVAEATLIAAIDETLSIASDHEASQVLMAAARSHTLTGAARDAYVRAADRLGDHEQNQALAALARAGR